MARLPTDHRPVPRIRGLISIADWITADDISITPPSFPLSLYLIDATCSHGLDTLTATAARIRLLTFALAYESGIAERDADGAVTGRVAVTISIATMTRFTGQKRVRILDALERLRASVWTLGRHGLTRIRSQHTAFFAREFRIDGDTVTITFDRVVSRHLMQPHGWSYIDLGLLQSARSIHAVGLLPITSFWRSMAARWQPIRPDRIEAPDRKLGEGAVYTKWSGFSSFKLSQDALLDLALAAPDMPTREITRNVLPAVQTMHGDAVDITRRKAGGYDVVAQASFKDPRAIQKPGILGFRSFSSADLPHLKIPAHEIATALNRLRMYVTAQNAQRLLQSWQVYIHRSNGDASLTDFRDLIDGAASDTIEFPYRMLSADETEAAENARWQRVKSLPADQRKQADRPISGALAWPVDEIEAVAQDETTDAPEALVYVRKPTPVRTTPATPRPRKEKPATVALSPVSVRPVFVPELDDDFTSDVLDDVLAEFGVELSDDDAAISHEFDPMDDLDD